MSWSVFLFVIGGLAMAGACGSVPPRDSDRYRRKDEVFARILFAAGGLALAAGLGLAAGRTAAATATNPPAATASH